MDATTSENGKVSGSVFVSVQSGMLRNALVFIWSFCLVFINVLLDLLASLLLKKYLVILS